jgi:hypothetical protein
MDQTDTETGSASPSEPHKARSSRLLIALVFVVVILVLSLAGGIFLRATFPSPSPQTSSQFTLGLGVSAGGNESFVNITYVTGPDLSASVIDINLSSSLHPSTFSCPRSGEAGNPYLVSEGITGATTWPPGLVWMLHMIPGNTTCPGGPLIAQGDNVTAIITDTSDRLVLFEATLPG